MTNIDMKTIEERAEEFASVYSRSEQHFAEECYITGANEQRTIDIENAIEWFRKENSHACKEWLDYECDKLRAAMLNE